MWARPERSYVVCATPRSGSTLLCATLAATGVAGRPEEFFEARAATGVPRRPREYLEGSASERVPDADPPVASYSDLRGVADYAEHLRAVLAHGTTPNGVFGAKLMWMHVEDLVTLARRVPGLARADLRIVLEALLGDPRYVWVRRRDRVRQAVSLWRAMQTHVWRAGSGRRDHAAEYDFPALDHLVRRLGREDDAWEAWFTAQGIAPLTLVYEEVAADPRAAAEAVAGAVGMALPPAPPRDDPALERQSDDQSAEWAERYRTEAA
jgi:trehalose 2-sulfotransferase